MNLTAFVSQEQHFIIQKWSLFLFEVSESRPRVEDLAAGRASLGFPGVALAVKSRPANAGAIRDVGSTPRSGRSPGGGHSNPLRVFLPGESPWTEEPGGLHGVAKTQTQLKGLAQQNAHRVCEL